MVGFRLLSWSIFIISPVRNYLHFRFIIIHQLLIYPTISCLVSKPHELNQRVLSKFPAWKHPMAVMARRCGWERSYCRGVARALSVKDCWPMGVSCDPSTYSHEWGGVSCTNCVSFATTTTTTTGNMQRSKWGLCLVAAGSSHQTIQWGLAATKMVTWRCQSIHPGEWFVHAVFW